MTQGRTSMMTSRPTATAERPMRRMLPGLRSDKRASMRGMRSANRKYISPSSTKARPRAVMKSFQSMFMATSYPGRTALSTRRIETL